MGKILAAIDFSDVSGPVLDAAIAQAAAHAGELVLLHVAPPDPTFIGYEAGPDTERQAQAQHLRSEHRQLQELAQQCKAQGIDATALLVAGPTAEKILEQAQRLDAAMVVIGSHGHGAVYQLLVGSVTEGVLKQAVCPVLVVPVRGGM